jgi:putative oxidoreductase
MTTNLDARLNTNSSAALNIFRIVFDFPYAVHGAPKLFAWPVDTGTVPVGT